MFNLNYALFFLDIFLTHIMHGVTGFAGTLLAMPFGLMLVGYPVAKPVLNVLGLASGIYVFLGNRKYVVWKELWKIVAIMGCGILVGICIKDRLLDKERMLYLFLGIFVIAVSVHGLFRELGAGKLFGKGKDRKNETTDTEKIQGERDDAKVIGKTEKSTGASECMDDGSKAIKEEKSESKAASALLYLTLPVAGIIHGIFVSGGPLLISYLTKKIPDKREFRSTISTVWIFLNGMVLVDDIRAGYWTGSLVICAILAAPFLFLGLKIGSILYQRMSQRTFMILSFILLLLMGIKLLF